MTRVIVRPQEPEEGGSDPEKIGRQFRKAMSLADSCGLADDDRYELARLLRGVPDNFDGSWRKLNEEQLHDLLSMLEGYLYINWIVQKKLDTPDEEE